MQARPRRIENEVAGELNAHFEKWGLSPVRRIPVLGRAGPDLTANELMWAVDVKSRREIPQSIRQARARPARFVGPQAALVGVSLKNLPLLWEGPPKSDLPLAKTIYDYWRHMADWTEAVERSDGTRYIPVVILHYPGTHIHNAVILMNAIHQKEL